MVTRLTTCALHQCTQENRRKLMNRKQMVITLSLGLMGMILLMSAGCDRFDLGMIDNNPDEFDAVEPNLVRANTMFGFKLLNELRQTDQDNNTLLSPYSLSVALAMTRNGAGGATERAIIDALQLQELDPASINANYIYLQRALQVPDSKVTLEIANALWAADNIEFDPGFLDRNNQFLDTEIATLDFTEPTNVSTINDSINANTNGAIPSVVDAIDPQTIACLISGIYFKGSWQEEFDTSQTQDEPFTLANGDKKQIQMMRRTDWYPYYEGEAFQAVRLPYEKDQMGMYLFLPDPSTDLNTFLDGLTVENWEAWMARFSERDVSLVMPKFKLQYSAELRGALEQLAMGIAFDEDRADFSRMTTSSGPVFISYLTHQAVVEVNEEGTEASTGSFVYFGDDLAIPQAEELPAPPIPFIVNRPFFLAIRDNRTETVLFMGVVMNPTPGEQHTFEPMPSPPIEPINAPSNLFGQLPECVNPDPPAFPLTTPKRVFLLVNIDVESLTLYEDWALDFKELQAADIDLWRGREDSRERGFIDWRFADATEMCTYFEDAGVLRELEELPRLSNEIALSTDMTTFSEASVINKNSSAEAVSLKIYDIDYPLGGRAAYLQSARATENVFASQPEVLRMEVYENFNPDQSPNRVIVVSFESLADRDAFEQSKAVADAEGQISERAAKVNVAHFSRLSRR